MEGQAAFTSSQQLIEALRRFEGCRLTSYKCPSGHWSIGYGFTWVYGEDGSITNVAKGMRMTQEQADAQLREILKPYEDYVNALGVCKTQGNFDALTDFAYNCGTGTLKKSSVLASIREGSGILALHDAFLGYSKAKVNGRLRTLRGLVNRREWEFIQYHKEDDSNAQI